MTLAGLTAGAMRMKDRGMLDGRRITSLLFAAGDRSKDLPYDCLIILGGGRCDCRVRAALEAGARLDICSGGNVSAYNERARLLAT